MLYVLCVEEVKVEVEVGRKKSDRGRGGRVTYIDKCKTNESSLGKDNDGPNGRGKKEGKRKKEEKRGREKGLSVGIELTIELWGMLDGGLRYLLVYQDVITIRWA